MVQTSADLSQRLTHLPDLRFTTSPARNVAVIQVDDAVRYQRIARFAAAMTDTSAWLLYRKLSPAARAATMKNLFGAHGIHRNIVRVPMGASDFTRNGRPYTYDDLPKGRSDPRLSHFSTSHDDAYVLPALREMAAINHRTTILANPWSPPAWMKSNQSLNTGRTAQRSCPAPIALGPLLRQAHPSICPRRRSHCSDHPSERAAPGHELSRHELSRAKRG